MKPQRDISWWYWLATTVLIASGLTGYAYCYYSAMALTAVQVIHFSVKEISLSAFPVQVRVAYLALLFLGQWAPMSWI